MNIIGQLQEWAASADEWVEMCALQHQVGDVPAGADDLAACQRMADLLDSCASRMRKSGMPRVFETTFTWQQLQADADAFRSGRNPYAAHPYLTELQPMLARDRYTDAEWAYASAGRCDVEEFPFARCGKPSSRRSFYRWCGPHDEDARTDHPDAYGR